MKSEDLLSIARVQAAKALRQFCGIREGGFEIESYSERDERIVYILRPTNGFGYLAKVIIDKEKKKVDTECYMIQGLCHMVLPEGEGKEK